MINSKTKNLNCAYTFVEPHHLDRQSTPRSPNYFGEAPAIGRHAKSLSSSPLSTPASRRWPSCASIFHAADDGLLEGRLLLDDARSRSASTAAPT